VTCKHSIPAGYRFCGVCGESADVKTCKCGFVVAHVDLFCGRCGCSLTSLAPSQISNDELNDRIDLEQLLIQATNDSASSPVTEKQRVTQSDIRNLISAQRKKT